MLWENINDSEWGTWERMGVKRRRIQQYGYIYHFKKQGFIQDEYTPVIPDFFDRIIDRFVKDGLFSKKPNQIIVNEYVQLGRRKWSIPPHIDSPILFGDTIVALTLGKPCTVVFTNDYKDYTKRFEFPVEVKSMYAMKGESRYDWVHSIPDELYNTSEYPQGNTRLSVTFREAIPDALNIETTKPNLGSYE